jgi:hypothetical protein
MSCIIKSPNQELNKASLKEEFYYLDRDKPQDPLAEFQQPANFAHGSG